MIELEKINITTKQLASLFGVSEKYLSELHIKKGMPNAGHNSWPLLLCITWRFNDLKKSYEEQLEKLKSEKSQDLLARRSAELKEMQIEEKKKTLVSRAEVAEKWFAEVSMINNNLTGLPIKMAPRLKGKTDEREIIEVLDEELNKLKAVIAKQELELEE